MCRYQAAGTTEQLAVYRYDDIRDRPAVLVLHIMAVLNIHPDWQSGELRCSVEPSPKPSVIDAENPAEVAAYCTPFDGEMRSSLGVTTLPWSAWSESPVTRWT